MTDQQTPAKETKRKLQIWLLKYRFKDEDPVNKSQDCKNAKQTPAVEWSGSEAGGLVHQFPPKLFKVTAFTGEGG